MEENKWILFNNTLLPEGCVDIANFEEDYNYNCWRVMNNSLKNTGEEIANFEENYNYNCWKINDTSIFNIGGNIANFEEDYNINCWFLNEDSAVNTGLGIADFEEKYNRVTWYIENNPENDLEINTGPWEEALGCFANNKKLEKIVLPKNVEELGEQTFKRSGLIEIEIENEELKNNIGEEVLPKNTIVK